MKQHFNGAGIQHSTGEELAKFVIHLPPLPELRRAVAKFDPLRTETQRLEGFYRQKQAALAALKKPSQHQAFSPEI